MKLLLKPCAAWVTALRNDPFRSARVKLTASYTAIFTILILAGSWAIVSIFTASLHDSIDYRVIALTYGEEAAQQIADSASNQLVTLIALMDIVLIFLFTVLSFMLATHNLAPIRKSVERERRFIANAAHELRTPLAVMKTGVETLPEIDTPATDIRELKTDLVEEIDELITMTDNLLALYRSDAVSAASHKKTRTATNISSVTEEVVSRFLPYARSKNIHLSHSVEQSHVMVAIQRDDYIRIVRNLIKNAIDYTPVGGSVTVSVLKRGSHALLTVHDTGCGIAQEDHARIFDRFYTAAKSGTYDDARGAGIGLSIVKSITDRIGGTVSVDSAPGRGSTFTVRLPLDAA